MAHENIPSGPPPQAVLMQTITGFMHAKTLAHAAELGVADLIAKGTTEVPAMAEKLRVDGEALYRMLRALASLGIFAETSARRFENTPLSELLRSDVPNSLRDYCVYAVTEENVRSWLRLDEVIRTGQPVFEKVMGSQPFEYLKATPVFAAKFSKAMSSMSAQTIPAFLAAHDFSAYQSIADVGGGYGHVIAAILEKHPNLRGAVFDLPIVIEGARKLIADRGLGARCEVAPCDFFESVPAGWNAYLMKHIIHDWNDADSIRILTSVRKAAAPGARLLLIEAVLPPGNTPHPAKWLDLHMMTILGGKERTEAEFAALFREAGFRFDRVIPTRSPQSIIEGTAV
jgi:hypothetical protein